jgi:hypothetical protein
MKRASIALVAAISLIGLAGCGPSMTDGSTGPATQQSSVASTETVALEHEVLSAMNQTMAEGRQGLALMNIGDHAGVWIHANRMYRRLTHATNIVTRLIGRPGVSESEIHRLMTWEHSTTTFWHDLAAFGAQ